MKYSIRDEVNRVTDSREFKEISIIYRAHFMFHRP